jgi:hypothetical protein
MQSMQVKLAPWQRFLCGSSFFLVKTSPHDYIEMQKQRLEAAECATQLVFSREPMVYGEGVLVAKGGNGESDRRLKEGRIGLIRRGEGCAGRRGGVPGCDLLAVSRGSGVWVGCVWVVCVMSVKIALGVVMGGAVSQPTKEGGVGVGIEARTAHTVRMWLVSDRMARGLNHTRETKCCPRHNGIKDTTYLAREGNHDDGGMGLSKLPVRSNWRAGRDETGE